MNKILVTGSSGFIGQYLCEKLSDEYGVYGVDILKSKDNINFYQVDINDTEKLKKIFKHNYFDYVIHSAAIKQLNLCESNRDKALQTNLESSINLYNLTKMQDSQFIFLSSDQVFDGKLGNYSEISEKNPINYYGCLKSCFENYLFNKPNTAICRTAMVFGKIPSQQNELFEQIKKENKLINQSFVVPHVIYKVSNNEIINLSSEEFCNPTYVGLLYNQIKQIINKNLSGIFHCCGGEKINRYDFGRKICSLFNLDSSIIHDLKSNDPLRPKDVSMNFLKSEQKIGIKFSTINEMLLSLKKEMNYEI